MGTFILIVHMFVAVGIVGLVLIQRGKGADAGAGFGAGASGTVFGARGSATVLSKATAILATLFFITSLALTYLGGRRAEAPPSLLDQAGVSQSAPAPKTPNGPSTAVPSPAPVPAAPAPVPAEAPQKSEPAPDANGTAPKP